MEIKYENDHHNGLLTVRLREFAYPADTEVPPPLEELRLRAEDRSAAHP
ncbi:hypothetical protein ACWDBD_44900 [Streptomyces sp. NPDC001118]